MATSTRMSSSLTPLPFLGILTLPLKMSAIAVTEPRARGPSWPSATAALRRTLECLFGSFNAEVRAAMLSGPIFPNASTAASATSFFSSFVAADRAVIPLLASGPMLPSASAA